MQTHQDYHVQMNHVPEKLYLVCETPEKFRITVNGAEFELDKPEKELSFCHKDEM